MTTHPLAYHFDAYPALNRTATPRSAARLMIEAVADEIDKRGLSPDQVSDIHTLFCTDHYDTWAFCVTVIMLGGNPDDDFSVDSNHHEIRAWRTYERAQLHDKRRVERARWPGNQPIAVEALLRNREWNRA
jgi:hypothetical protein